MEIRPFGAAKTVTGSCYSLKTSKSRILIDCGTFQGNKKLNKFNYEPFGFNPKHYRILLLTHAHLDHCGRIPKLVKDGFKGRIYCTSATKDLAEIIMLDSANIEKHDTEHENVRRQEQGLPLREPLYTEEDVQDALKLFKIVEYNERFPITKDILVEFHNAGHILGAAFLKLFVIEDGKTRKIVFSGDLGQYGAPIVKDPEPIGNADYVFIESTYGDRLHEPLEERKHRLLDIINNNYKKGGKLLIPSFAVERTQELLFDINELVERKILSNIRVYLDSPMAIRTTEVFKHHPEDYNRLIKGVLDSGDNPFSFPGLIPTLTVEDSIGIDKNFGPAIIIAGSGMCTAGRIKHHIKHHISNPKNTILFVGYQAEGTLGFYIKNGEKNIRLLGSEVPVNAKVEVIDSFSAHGDQRGLISWLKTCSPYPKKVFIIHGEEKSQKVFTEKIEDELKIPTHIPSMKEKIVL